ncbi:MAG: response regulator transcription factor [Cyclobacteriaceae bacterium]|nr:response regulator transcription factor [Cyclobacteriaceae bacterium HetDA_MAG_MS6]
MIYQCVIVDDEPLAQQLLKSYVERVDWLHLGGVFDHPLAAQPYLTKNKVDVIFLDIEMPQLSGIAFADLIPNLLIVFTTAHADYAVKSYEKKALDYLLKPITFERFLMAIDKIPKSGTTDPVFKKDQNTIFIRSEGGYINLAYDEIGFVEGLKDYVIFHTSNGRHIVHHSLKKLEQSLPQQFLRVHYSFIINFNLISHVKDHHAQLFDTHIPISKKHRETFYEMVQQKMI